MKLKTPKEIVKELQKLNHSIQKAEKAIKDFTMSKTEKH